MGCGGSSEAGPPGVAVSPEQENKSRSIDKFLREEERRLSREVKMLLLGPGASGKSTILKQMKLIHLNGFTPTELESYRQQIWVNLCESMSSALDFALGTLDLKLATHENETHREMFRPGEWPDLRQGEAFPGGWREAMESLWADQSVQEAVARGSEVNLAENMSYYYTSLGRLFSPSYSPTPLDVLHCRQKTTGITETTFGTPQLTYRLFDVGGQRSERKKWIHCFENVTAVLFLVAISGYDQCLLEDRDSNQMQEALMLFDSVCNSQWFTKTSIIVFLNKIDLFQQRILQSSIRAHFPDYTGNDTDYLAAREYFKLRFTRLNRSTSKEVYTHFTTAIDTNLVKATMLAVTDIIVSANLSEGMMF